MTDLNELLERVKKAEGYSNELDIAIELAVFKPDHRHKAIRTNAAGSKVIYTTLDGKDETFWAPDWTMSRASRERAAALLSALISKEPQS